LQRRALAVAAALALVYLVWGSTYLGIAVAIETLPPLLMAGARFLIAGAILYSLALTLGERKAGPDRRQWRAALATGTLLLAAGNGGVSWAQQTVPSGIAALVIASIPLWIVVLDRLLFGARLTWPVTLGVTVGFAGVAILIDPRGSSAVDAAGGLVLLLAAVGWATGTLFSRGQQLTVAPLLGAGMQMLCGGAVLVAAGIVTGELGRLNLEQMSARSLTALAYLVVFGSIVAFSAYTWLLRNARTSLVATYAYVNPVVAVALGASILGEAIDTRTLLAGAVVLVAVALIVSAQPRRRVHSESASSTERSRSRRSSSTSLPSENASPARATSS
jgi:drug/metabolite transporter (DMT)-like permease